MSIATHELMIPGSMGEIERRAARAGNAAAARRPGWSPGRWLRSRRTGDRSHPTPTTAAMTATTALARSGVAAGMPRID